MATKREQEIAQHLRDIFILSWPTRRDLPSPEDWSARFDQHTKALLDFVIEIGHETEHKGN